MFSIVRSHRGLLILLLAVLPLVAFGQADRSVGGSVSVQSSEVRSVEMTTVDTGDATTTDRARGDDPSRPDPTEAAAVGVGGNDCDDGEREVRPGVCARMTQVDSAAAEAQDYNSSRSNKARAVQADGEEIDEEADRIAPAQDYNAARSNKPSSIRDDGGDCDDGEREVRPGVCVSTTQVDSAAAEAQDYNSSRSNKARRAVQADGDNDDVSEGEEGSLETAARGFMRFDEIQSEVRVEEETGALRLSQVAVDARTVRSWSAEDRAAFAALRQTVASNTPEDASLRITQRLLDDSQIEEILVNETESRVRYRATLRLFGLIPIEREVEATAQADGQVTINYPWYSFLATKPDTQRIRSILQDTLGILTQAPDRSE